MDQNKPILGLTGCLRARIAATHNACDAGGVRLGRGKQSWMLLSNHAWHDYFGGLAAFRIFRETGDECKFAVQVYVDQGLLWNVQQQTQLLEAEQSYSCGNILDAQTSYMNAITSARTQVL